MATPATTANFHADSYTSEAVGKVQDTDHSTCSNLICDINEDLLRLGADFHRLQQEVASQYNTSVTQQQFANQVSIGHRQMNTGTQSTSQQSVDRCTRHAAQPIPNNHVKCDPINGNQKRGCN